MQPGIANAQKQDPALVSQCREINKTIDALNVAAGRFEQAAQRLVNPRPMGTSTDAASPQVAPDGGSVEHRLSLIHRRLENLCGELGMHASEIERGV
jgi:hypothetical protein